MAFRVFPVEPNAVFRLRPREVGGFLDFDELAGETPRSMFLRIAKARADCSPTLPGGSDPTLWLRAGTGTPVELEQEGPVSIRDQPDVNSVPVATAELATEPLNVYAVRVDLHSEGSRWQLQIRNNDASERQFTLVIADDDLESKKPWMDLPRSVVFFFRAGQTVTQPATKNVNVANLGTGKLTLSLAGPAAGSRFKFPVPLTDVQANSCRPLLIQFNGPPPPPSTFVEELFIARSNDPRATEFGAHNDRIWLRAETEAPIDPGETEPPPPPPLKGACNECPCREFQPPVFGSRCERPTCQHDEAKHGIFF
jgi:hypothetical protein